MLAVIEKQHRLATQLAVLNERLNQQVNSVGNDVIVDTWLIYTS
ncbi:hypothetical protein [Photobacterium carnosum]|jgi:hypothetical protein|nr:hypothetical protein [Photobacterium carnosum]